MRLPQTILWIGALTTASSAIQCGGAEEPSGAGGGLVAPIADGQAARDAGARDSGGQSSDQGRKPDGPIADARAGETTQGGGYASDADPDGSAGCPASAPTAEDRCVASSTCTYDGKVCTCPRHPGDISATWSCFSAPVEQDAAICPASAPHDNSLCSIEGLSCRYGRTNCFCGGRRNADDAVWECR